MNDAHTPTLSSIVDQLTARIEAIEQRGEPSELAALKTARATLVDWAHQQDRLLAVIDQITHRMKDTA